MFRNQRNVYLVSLEHIVLQFNSGVPPQLNVQFFSFSSDPLLLCFWGLFHRFIRSENNIQNAVQHIDLVHVGKRTIEARNLMVEIKTTTRHILMREDMDD